MKKLVLAIILASGLLFANSGEQLAKDNGCMECHNIMGKKLAPAFMGTARKNIRWFGADAKSKIIASIKNGSKGKYMNFKNTEMPAYGNLKSEDLETLASWILTEYNKNRMLYGSQRGQGRGKQQ